MSGLDDYNDYDDFGLDSCGKGGGGHTIKRGTKQSSDQGSGKVYSTKHVRLLEARKEGAGRKKPLAKKK